MQRKIKSKHFDSNSTKFSVFKFISTIQVYRCTFLGVAIFCTAFSSHLTMEFYLNFPTKVKMTNKFQLRFDNKHMRKIDFNRMEVNGMCFAVLCAYDRRWSIFMYYMFVCVWVWMYIRWVLFPLLDFHIQFSMPLLSVP